MERYTVNRRSKRKSEGFLIKWRRKYNILRKRSWITSGYDLNVSNIIIRMVQVFSDNFDWYQCLITHYLEKKKKTKHDMTVVMQTTPFHCRWSNEAYYNNRNIIGHI